MKTTTSTALALLLGLGLALPAAAQQPAEPTFEVQDEQSAPATGAAQAQQTGGQLQQPAPTGTGEMEAEGTVATVDHFVLTTEEGERYTLAGDAPVQGLEPGTRVRITYRQQDGEKVVTGLEPVRQR